MMHGHEKSDLVIVAVKPANKARKAPCGGVCGGGRSGVGGSEGRGPRGIRTGKARTGIQKPGSRVTGAGAYTATCAVTHPGGGAAVCGKAARTVLCGGRAMNARPYRYKRRKFIRLLVLLCHKFWCPFRAAQHGQRESVVARAATNLRRIVAIEFGTWRSGRNGGSSGLVTFA